MNQTVEFLIDTIMQPLGLIFGILTPREGTISPQRTSNVGRTYSSVTGGAYGSGPNTFAGYTSQVGHVGAGGADAPGSAVLTTAPGQANLPGGVTGGIYGGTSGSGVGLGGYIKAEPQPPGTGDTLSGIYMADPGSPLEPIDPGGAKRKELGLNFRY
jgi:hypothetical protein